MGDSKPGMLSDLVKGALTTAISVLVTFYVTSAIKKDQYQKDDFDKEKQRSEAFDKTNKILSDYVSRYDSLHARYLNLLEQKANMNSQNYIDEGGQKTNNNNVLNTVSQSLLSGNWITTDGAYNWNFTNNRLTISGLGNYENSYAATGSYQAAGGVVSGKYHVSMFAYSPVNYNYNFEATISSDGSVMYGTMSDAAGTYTLALYKN